MDQKLFLYLSCVWYEALLGTKFWRADLYAIFACYWCLVETLTWSQRLPDLKSNFHFAFHVAVQPILLIHPLAHELMWLIKLTTKSNKTRRFYACTFQDLKFIASFISLGTCSSSTSSRSISTLNSLLSIFNWLKKKIEKKINICSYFTTFDDSISIIDWLEK